MRIFPATLATIMLGLSAVALAQNAANLPEGEEPAVYLARGAFDILAVLPPAPHRTATICADDPIAPSFGRRVGVAARNDDHPELQ